MGGTGLLASERSASPVDASPPLEQLFPGDELVIEEYGTRWYYRVTDVIQVSADDVQLYYPVHDERHTLVRTAITSGGERGSGVHVLIVARLTGE